jgi:TetR/AcrR family transcriptional regulator
MNANPLTRSQTERADHTRARILEAAICQFSENGLAGARTERIAEAAGVNKALLYYYFSSKEALYSAAIEAVAEGVQATTVAVLDADASAGERFLIIVLSNFDRIYSNPGFANLMQQEMMRLHRGEKNALALLAERLFGPLWLRVREVVEQGIREGEMIPVDWMQMLYAGLGANVFYFLSAPLIGLALGFQPLERSMLEFRRKAAIEYLGQTIFLDREHGAQVAARVLAAAPMPRAAGVGIGVTKAAGINMSEFKTDEVRHR